MISWFGYLIVVFILFLFLAITLTKPENLLPFSKGLMWLCIAATGFLLMGFLAWRMFFPDDPVVNSLLGNSLVEKDTFKEPESESLKFAKTSLKDNKEKLNIASVISESDKAITHASEIWARRSAFKQSYLLDNAIFYNVEGKKIRDLKAGISVKVNFDDRVMPVGFIEYLVKTVYLKDDKEQGGYVRQSAVSAVSLLEEKVQKGFANATWWDLPSEDKNVITQKAVNLSPGQTSEILTYMPKEEANYHLFRNDKNAQFTAWINGKEIFFGPSNQKLPDFRDFLRVRVQLSPSASSDNTVRFVVVKPD